MQTGPGPPPLWEFDPYARRSRGRRLFKALMAVLMLALVASPFLPATIRISLPDGWRLQLPRVEIVRQGAGRADSAMATAHDLNEASTFGLKLPVTIGIGKSEDGGAQKLANLSAAAHSNRTTRHRVQARREEIEEKGDMTYVPDQGVSIVPVTVRTEVRLSSAADRDAIHADDARQSARDDGATTSSDWSHSNTSDERWPVLCGQVVDEFGTPAAGARVELESAGLTVSADASGRFCIACPPGERVVRFDAAGRGRATRIVALQSSLFDMRIALSQKP